jgi:hypothetical protein
MDLDRNFKCVKRWIQKSQIWLHMTTWFAYKIGFYKIRKSKTYHFWKIMQITPYSISNNYKLSMVAFDNTLQVQSNCMEAPSMCAQCVEQFFVPLDLGHTCHGLVSQMTSWLNCSQIILHPNHHPIWHLFAYLPNMLQTSKLWHVFWPIKGNL